MGGDFLLLIKKFSVILNGCEGIYGVAGCSVIIGLAHICGKIVCIEECNKRIGLNACTNAVGVGDLVSHSESKLFGFKGLYKVHSGKLLALSLHLLKCLTEEVTCDIACKSVGVVAHKKRNDVLVVKACCVVENINCSIPILLGETGNTKIVTVLILLNLTKETISIVKIALGVLEVVGKVSGTELKEGQIAFILNNNICIATYDPDGTLVAFLNSYQTNPEITLK